MDEIVKLLSGKLFDLLASSWGMIGSLCLLLGFILLLLSLVDKIATPWFDIPKESLDKFGDRASFKKLGLFAIAIGAAFALPIITSPVDNHLPSVKPSPIISSSAIQPSKTSLLETLNLSKPNSEVVKMDGSVSAVKMIRVMQQVIRQQRNGLQTSYGENNARPCGSNDAVTKLRNDEIEVAVVSRELTDGEKRIDNMISFPIATDAVAVVVSQNNPYRKGLTIGQLRDIYTCQITNWKEVGGEPAPIKVLNRAKASGTQTYFKEDILSTGDFCPDGERSDGSSFKTFAQDNDEIPLNDLGNNGIYYATEANTRNQSGVRIVPIQGKLPADKEYSFRRTISLVILQKTSQKVKQFVEFALSSDGRNIASQYHFPVDN